ncbi:hypothetical protein [Frondihabitans cladoniiphilus]|uniref:Uncharacterized protein n=1 Tax=Frondihabitans cladoniiphilus TaxID=715785 RepID=A0ABP8WDF5_9MICO
MERIFYANASVLTGTSIARALISYAEALARRSSSAAIDIPIRNADGTVGRANFLLGPASQIVAESADSEFDEIEDEELVARFQRQTDLIGPARAEAFPRGAVDLESAPDFEPPAQD